MRYEETQYGFNYGALEIERFYGVDQIDEITITAGEE